MGAIIHPYIERFFLISVLLFLGGCRNHTPCPITQKINQRPLSQYDYKLVLLGSMNGRYSSGIPLSTHFEHEFLEKSIKAYLATIQDGEIGKV